MSDYIENTFYLSREDTKLGKTEESSIQINQSMELDDLAEKLTDDCLKRASNGFLSKDYHNKAKMSDLINAMGLIFSLMRVANNRPLFLVMRSGDWKTVEAYYFFIGSFEEIKQKFIKLSEDDDNLQKNNWHY